MLDFLRRETDRISGSQRRLPMGRSMDQLMDIPIRIERKAVRRIYLKVHLDRTVSLTAPIQASEKEVRAFAEEKRTWIQKALSQMPPLLPVYLFTEGETHFFMGHPVTLHVEKGSPNGCHIKNGCACLTVRDSRTDRAKLIRQYWEQELEQVIAGQAESWAAVLHVHPSSFSIRHMKSRWGTCQIQTGRLCFALDLSSKPEDCIEYVVLHELTHLLEAGHTPRFHALMTQHMPDWKQRKSRLNAWNKEFF